MTRVHALTAGLLAALVVMAAPAAAQTEPSVQRSEFTLDLPVSSDGRIVGELTAVIDASGLIAIDAASWHAFGPRHFTAGLVEQLAARANGDRIPVAAFQDAGLDLRYDPSELVLHLQPRRDQRVLHSLSMRGTPEGAGSQSPEARLAAYLNMRGLQEYVRRDDGSASARRVLLDGAVRAYGRGGVALEWSAAFDDSAAQRWTRGDVRLVHDDPARAIRYSVGDIAYLTTEFQGAVPLLGVSAERRFNALQPNRTLGSTGPRSFTLTRPSRVDIYLNGAMQRSFRLEPGRYGLEDFSTVDGANDVRIEIVDDTGQREVVEFTLFLDATLLRRGEAEFSANAGVRRDDDASTRIHYDGNRPAWSGFLRYGLTDSLTAGASLQGERGLSVGGVEAVAGTRVGTFSTSLSVSDSDRAGHGRAGTLRWAYDLPGQAGSRRLDVSTIYFGRDYVSLGVDAPVNRFSWQTQARLSTLLPFGMAASFNARHARSRDPLRPDESRVGFALSRRFGTVSTTFGLERITGPERDTRAYVNLLIPLGRDYSVLANWQSLDNQSRVEWSRYPRERVGDLSGSVGVETADYGRSATADLAYVGNRFMTRLEHDILRLGPRADLSEQRTRLQFDTAIAYADGHVAIGRPVSDAFALVSRHETLRDSRVLVDPTEDGALAIADRFGPALVPRLFSYRPQQIRWDAVDLPENYDLGSPMRYVEPGYRAGYHFEVGSAATISVLGTALGADGTPLALAGGEVRADDGRDVPPLKTFTNRAGRFAVQGLAPGRYAITFFTDPPKVVRFVVADDASGLVTLGSLTTE